MQTAASESGAISGRPGGEEDWVTFSAGSAETQTGSRQEKNRSRVQGKKENTGNPTQDGAESLTRGSETNWQSMRTQEVKSRTQRGQKNSLGQYSSNRVQGVQGVQEVQNSWIVCSDKDEKKGFYFFNLKQEGRTLLPCFSFGM